jgi:hypothetical protein
MTIWFDMDGTIADLYGVDGWLDNLINEDTRPYDIAKPLVNMAYLARLLHKAQANGYEIGIISWTSRGGSDLYNGEIALAKMVWLHKHLPSVEWDEIKIVRYGTDKRTACGGGILFDDEEPNRKAWGDGAFTPNEIIRVLKGVIK